jgi:stress response protein YsnF
MVSQSYENKFGIKLSDDQRISNLDSNGLIKTEELVQKIPLYNEKLDVTKKSENGNLKIEKKWITVKKEIEIPLKYEEIFINDKVFDSYSDKEKGEIFFQIKSKIYDTFLRERTDEKDNKQPDPTGSEVEIVCWEPEGMELNKNVISEKAISLSYVTLSDQTNIQQADQTNIQQADQTNIQQADQTNIQQADQTNIQQADQTNIQQADQTNIQQADQTNIQQADQTNIQQADQTNIQQADQTKTQETFELWGEEIIIDKKMVKLAEIVIKKYQVNEKRKIDVEVNREKLTLKFPGNFKEEIS